MEDAVLAEVALRLALRRTLSAAAYRDLRVRIHRDAEQRHRAFALSDVQRECRAGGPRGAGAVIRDLGVGVFASVAERYRLAEEEQAIGELLKGKATSMSGARRG